MKNPNIMDIKLPAIGIFTMGSGYAGICPLEQNSFVQNGTTYYKNPPSAGKPVETDLVSVTVTRDDGSTVNALAPDYIVPSKEKGA